MKRYSSEVTNIIEPLDFLVQCSLQEILLLETLDPNCISEQISNTTDNESMLSIDIEDLEEWLDESYAEEDYNELKGLQECLGSLQKSTMSQQAICPNLKSTSVTDSNFRVNTQQINLTEKSKEINLILPKKVAIDKQMNFIQNNLERSMLKTQMSRQHLYKTGNINKTHIGCRKTNNSFQKVMDSRKSLEVVDKIRNMTRIGFFSGKRKTLTNELELSRNHLKNYGYDMMKSIKKRKFNVGKSFTPAVA